MGLGSRICSLGSRFEGCLGSRVRDLGFRVWGLGLWVSGLETGVRVLGVELWDQGFVLRLGFRVLGPVFMVLGFCFRGWG